MKTRNKIVDLHRRGFANAQIARKVGVSRQRVWQVLHPEARNRKYGMSANGRFAAGAAGSVWLRSTGIAAFLGVHPNTIRRWSDEGIIPCVRLGRRQDRRFDPQFVLENIRKGTP